MKAFCYSIPDCIKAIARPSLFDCLLIATCPLDKRPLMGKSPSSDMWRAFMWLALAIFSIRFHMDLSRCLKMPVVGLGSLSAMAASQTTWANRSIDMMLSSAATGGGIMAMPVAPNVMCCSWTVVLGSLSWILASTNVEYCVRAEAERYQFWRESQRW